VVLVVVLVVVSLMVLVVSVVLLTMVVGIGVGDGSGGGGGGGMEKGMEEVEVTRVASHLRLRILYMGLKCVLTLSQSNAGHTNLG
jgi:hypothetical protein